MKKLFIYYSLTGTGDKVAKILKNNNIDIRKVETLEELPKNFILRILTGGYKAMINYKDKLNDFDKKIDEYDEIIIGTPIWNNRISSPINTVLTKLNLNDKKTTFILYSGSGKNNKAMEFISKNYKNSKIINLKDSNIEKDIKSHF